MTVMEKVPDTLRKPTIQPEATRVTAKPVRKTADQATGAEDLLENLTGQEQFQGEKRLKGRRIGWWYTQTHLNKMVMKRIFTRVRSTTRKMYKRKYMGLRKDQQRKRES